MRRHRSTIGQDCVTSFELRSVQEWETGPVDELVRAYIREPWGTARPNFANGLTESRAGCLTTEVERNLVDVTHDVRDRLARALRLEYVASFGILNNTAVEREDDALGALLVEFSEDRELVVTERFPTLLVHE